MFGNRIVFSLLAAFLAFSLSSYFFYGVGVDRATVKYESLIAKANDEAEDKYKAREAELLKQGALHVERVKALERRRKPIEKEVIRYVTKDQEFDDSGCAVTNDGLQLVSRYIVASFDAEN